MKDPLSQKKKFEKQRNELDQSDIHPAPGVSLKRWVWRPSKYDQTIKKWTLQEEIDPRITTSQKMTIVTYNISKEQYGRSYRTPALLDSLQSLDADIMILQVFFFPFEKKIINK